MHQRFVNLSLSCPNFSNLAIEILRIVMSSQDGWSVTLWVGDNHHCEKDLSGSGNNCEKDFSGSGNNCEKMRTKLMMTSLTAVDLFVWHESLEGGRAGAPRRASQDWCPHPLGRGILFLLHVFSKSLSWGSLLKSFSWGILFLLLVLGEALKIKVLVWFTVLVLDFPSHCLDQSLFLGESYSYYLSWGSLFHVLVLMYPSDSLSCSWSLSWGSLIQVLVYCLEVAFWSKSFSLGIQF